MFSFLEVLVNDLMSDKLRQQQQGKNVNETFEISAYNEQNKA